MQATSEQPIEEILQQSIVAAQKIAAQNRKEDFDLKVSEQGEGQLEAVKIAVIDGKKIILDGNGRLEADPSWREEIIPQVKTMVDAAYAILTYNHGRRGQTSAELKELITGLIAAGQTPQQIRERSGIGLTTIYEYMPQEAKNEAKSKAGKASAEARAKKSVPQVEQKIETPEVAAPKPAEKPFDYTIPCDSCGNDGVSCHRERFERGTTGYVCTSKALKQTVQQRGSYLDQLQECKVCHVMVNNYAINSDGVCNVCEEQQKTRDEQNTASKEAVSDDEKRIREIIHSRAEQWHSDRCKRDSAEEQMEREGIKDAHEKVNALIAAGKLDLGGAKLAFLIDPTPSYSNWDKDQEKETSPIDSTEAAIKNVQKIGENSNVFGEKQLPKATAEAVYDISQETQLSEGAGQTEDQQPDSQPEPHQEEDWVVNIRRFENQMEAKIQENMHTKGLAWRNCSAEELIGILKEYIETGQWVSVANLAFFLAEPSIQQTKTEPKLKTIRCECGFEILVVPDVNAMAKAITDHINNCEICNGILSDDVTYDAQDMLDMKIKRTQVEQSLLSQLFHVAAEEVQL